MITLFGNVDSGNCHKVQMVLAMAGVGFRRVDVSQPRGEPSRAEFLALNPMGKVPVLLLPDGDVLSESGAILCHYAAQAGLWPTTPRAGTETLRWMFFEQYSHEPALAVMRYLRRFAAPATVNSGEAERLRPRALRALAAMESRLRGHEWLAHTQATVADIALYPYTRMAAESGVELLATPAITAWLARVESLPHFVPVYDDAAREVVGFEDWFAAGRDHP